MKGEEIGMEVGYRTCGMTTNWFAGGQHNRCKAKSQAFKARTSDVQTNGHDVTRLPGNGDPWTQAQSARRCRILTAFSGGA